LKKIYLFFLILVNFSNNGNANSQKMILDNLSKPGQTFQGQKWFFVTDKVMGGLSEGEIRLQKIGNISCYRMTGNITTKNNGGFIQIRAMISPNIHVSKFKGVYLKVFGNNKNYNLHIRTGLTVAPWQYYGFSFFSSDKWLEIRAPFEEFKKSNFYQPKKLSNQKIKSIGLVAGFDDFKSDICLSEIGFY